MAPGSSSLPTRITLLRYLVGVQLARTSTQHPEQHLRISTGTGRIFYAINLRTAYNCAFPVYHSWMLLHVELPRDYYCPCAWCDWSIKRLALPLWRFLDSDVTLGLVYFRRVRISAVENHSRLVMMYGSFFETGDIFVKISNMGITLNMIDDT